MDTMPLTAADVGAVVGNNRNYDGFGYGEGMWFWIIIILFAFWGNNGFGNRNGQDTLLSDEFIKRDIFNTNQNVSESACQTQRDVLESRYTNQLGLSQLSANMQNCCCETQKEILQNRYDNAIQTQTLSSQMAECCCNLRAEGLANTQKILDLIQQDKIDQLRDQVYTTNLALNNANLANQIVNSIIPRPAPAYPSCSPFVPSYYGFNNGCNC